jgi:hypothetical protein
MLVSTFCILLSATVCLCSPIADLVSPTGSADAVAIGPKDRNASWWRAKETHYLRMPINRHVFNGTGRKPHRKGPHVENPINRRWGWEHLDDLGGIAYIIQRASAPKTVPQCTDLTSSWQSISEPRLSRFKSSSIPAPTSCGSTRSVRTRRTSTSAKATGPIIRGGPGRRLLSAATSTLPMAPVPSRGSTGQIPWG